MKNDLYSKIVRAIRAMEKSGANTYIIEDWMELEDTPILSLDVKKFYNGDNPSINYNFVVKVQEDSMIVYDTTFKMTFNDYNDLRVMSGKKIAKEFARDFICDLAICGLVDQLNKLYLDETPIVTYN